MIGFERTDGGRAEAGYRGRAGDCVTRAIALATRAGAPTGDDYRAVYQVVARAELDAGGKRSARNGVRKKATAAAMRELGFERVGLTARANGGRWLTLTEVWERFGGRARAMVIQTTGHVAAIVDGRLMDATDIRTYLWEDEFGDVETRERKTATVWLAPEAAR